MATTVKAVANEFLNLAKEDGAPIDPLQMQKLVYLAQGWTLGLTQHRLFREAIEAWRYGPVVPDLYHSLKVFGDRPIKGRLKRWSESRQRLVDATHDFDDTESRIIKNLWRKYGRWEGTRLIDLTHVPDGPWRRTRDAYPGENDARIPQDWMEEWFAVEAERARAVNYRATDVH